MPRSRKNEKGILEVGIFIELKNRHIIQLLVVPKLLAGPPDIVPLPHKTKGNKEGGRRLKSLRMGNVWIARDHL